MSPQGLKEIYSDLAFDHSKRITFARREGHIYEAQHHEKRIVELSNLILSMLEMEDAQWNDHK